jgi:gamma-glutamyltranspeptidase
MPTVRILNEGYPVTPLMQRSLEIKEKEIMNEPTMRNFFVNNATGKLYKEGEILRNPVLAETYRRLAVSSDPVQSFYHGEIAQTIAFEISTINNGYVTQKDLQRYRTVIDQQPLQNDHFNGDLVMCGPKPSSSFAVTQLILSVMSRKKFMGCFCYDQKNI